IGDRVQITNIAFKDKAIYLELNGGPKKKTKWYEHIQVSGLGGTMNSQDPSRARPTGAGLTIEFKHHIPEMTGAELKQLLNPVLDFSVSSAAEVYLETLPPKVTSAVKNHEVLVGMNREMVILSKSHAPQTTDDKEDPGKAYQE